MILDPLGTAAPKIKISAGIHEGSAMGKKVAGGLLDLASIELDLLDVADILTDINVADATPERLDALHAKLSDLTMHAGGAVLAVGMVRFAQKNMT